MNRTDNVKTAISRGAGAWGTIHPTYRAYARAVGFHIDACAGSLDSQGQFVALTNAMEMQLESGAPSPESCGCWAARS